MKKAIEIIKTLLFPFLMDGNKSINSLNIDWNKLVQAFISYDNDPNILQKELSALPFNDYKKLLTELPDIYNTFMDELAEDYVLDNHSDLTDDLLRTNTVFKEKVSFYTLMKGVITKMERKRIIDNLKAEDVFSEKDIKLAFKKKGREELISKFKKWDKELEQEKKVQDPDSTEVKVVSLWQKYAKYAIAASIALLIGVFYFTSDNTIDKTQKIQYVKAPGEKIKVLTNTGLGYTDPSTKKEIIVVFKPTGEALSSSYSYTNDTLHLFQKRPKEKIILIEYENNLYLKIKEDFYTLKNTKKPVVIQKLEDKIIEEQLKRIIFNNR